MHKIIIDTDPGTDDVFALLWLAALSKANACQVLCVTTCDGNVKCTQTYANAVKVLDLLNLNHIPVGKSLKLDTPVSTDYHGEDGLGGASNALPPTVSASCPNTPYEDAPLSHDLIVETLLKHDRNTVTLIGIGPCTNLALAEKKSPGILARARQVVLMGGAFEEKGNITSLAEFNVYFDPPAFRDVVSCGAQVLILPLDVTQNVLFGYSHLQEVRAYLEEHHTKRPLAQFGNADANHDSRCDNIFKFIARVLDIQIQQSLRYRQAGGEKAMVMHDGATILALFYPEVLGFKHAHVFVETEGMSAGKTFVDNRHAPVRPLPNAFIANTVDGPKAMSIFVEDLKSYFESVFADEAKVNGHQDKKRKVDA